MLAQGQSVNTRIELTITDARGDGTPITKTVSMMTADRSWGRIRTQGEARSANGTRFPVILNVDARPTLISNNGAWNRARVELTIEYRPADEPIFARTRHRPLEQFSRARIGGLVKALVRHAARGATTRSPPRTAPRRARCPPPRAARRIRY